jgi:mRNA-degrading endonuclease RelE of RelBE toxin-antitoxin system
MAARATEPWSVVWAASAARALDRLPVKAAGAVYAFVTGPLAGNPIRTTRALHAPFEGERVARVGTSYCVVAELDEATLTVRVILVAHRADAYRPR